MPWERKLQEELFSFSDIDKLVPDNHLLRHIDRYVDFSFIYDLVRPVYSEVLGRKAIDPQLVLRIFLLGYLYDYSERRLFDEISMHAAYRWFLGLTFSDPIPDRTTLVKLRNEKWSQIGAFEQILDRVVDQCLTAGLIKGKHVTVDGTQIMANASVKSLEPLVVPYSPREYIEKLRREDAEPVDSTPDKPSDGSRPRIDHPEDKNFRGQKLSNQTHRSRTDPEARLFRKSNGQDTALSFIGMYLADTHSRVVLAIQAGTPGIHTESSMTVDMLDSLDPKLREPIKILCGDAHYGNTALHCDLADRNITPHTPLLFKDTLESMPTWDNPPRNSQQQLNRNKLIREAEVRNSARETVKTANYRKSQVLRKRIEHLFAEAKVCHGLRRARCRGLEKMRTQLACTATVQNIKRLVSFCIRRNRKSAAEQAVNLSNTSTLQACFDLLCFHWVPLFSRYRLTLYSDHQFN